MLGALRIKILIYVFAFLGSKRVLHSHFGQFREAKCSQGRVKFLVLANIENEHFRGEVLRSTEQKCLNWNEC